MSIWIIKFTHPFKKAAIPVCLKPCQITRTNFLWWCSIFACIVLNLHQLPAAKKDMQKQASQQTFGSSYFVRALAQNVNKKVRLLEKPDPQIQRSDDLWTKLFWIMPSAWRLVLTLRIRSTRAAPLASWEKEPHLIEMTDNWYVTSREEGRKKILLFRLESCYLC